MKRSVLMLALVLTLISVLLGCRETATDGEAGSRGLADAIGPANALARFAIHRVRTGIATTV